MIVVQRKLFWKIYLTLLASLIAVAVLMGALWSVVGESGRRINIYRAEVEAFSAALLSGVPNPLPGEIGLHSQKILAAFYQSASTGRAVEV